MKKKCPSAAGLLLRKCTVHTPIAASIATSAAACIPGTVANECVCPRGSKEDVILGHAGGYTTVNIKTEGEQILSGTVIRTACPIMKGTLWVEI